MKSKILPLLVSVSLLATSAFSAAAVRSIPRTVPLWSDLANENINMWSSIIVEEDGGVAIGTPTASLPAWAVSSDYAKLARTDASGSGKWIRQYDGEVNVKWTGATGDGITDDHDAILNALAIASDTGFTAYFPEGTYRTTSLGKLNYSGIKLVGDGPDRSVIIGDFSALSLESGETPNLFWWKESGNTNTIIGPSLYGLYLRGDSTAGSTNRPQHLLYFAMQNQQDVTVRNCWFSHSANGALDITGRRVSIENVYVFDDYRNTNLVSQGKGGLSAAGFDWTLRNVAFRNVGVSDPPGTSIDAHTIYVSSVTNLTADGIYSYGYAGDGGADGDNDNPSTQDVGGRMSNATWNGVHVSGSSEHAVVVNTSANNVMFNGLNVDGVGDIYVASATNVVFNGLTYYCPTQTSYALTCSSGTTRNVTFRDCDINCGGVALILAGGGYNAVLQNCQIVSASTARAIHLQKWSGLTIANCDITLAGGSGAEFVNCASGYVSDNLLVRDSVLQWTAANQAGIFDLRYTAGTNVVLRNDRLFAPSASAYVIDNYGTSTTYTVEGLDVNLSTGNSRVDRYDTLKTLASGALSGSVWLTPRVDDSVQIVSSAASTPEFLLSETNAVSGTSWRVVNQDGSNTLDVDNTDGSTLIKTVGTSSWAEFRWTGSTYVLVGYGSL